MHILLASACLAADSILLRIMRVSKAGHVTLDSKSILLELSLACGQNLQFALHFPRL